MAYAKRKTRRTTRKSTKPMLTVKTRPKKVAVARKDRVDRIAKQVRSLQVAKYGAPQVQRQSFRNTDGTSYFTVSATRPVAFCLEAICTGNEVYTCQQNVLTGLYSELTVGSWVQQIFPLNAANPANLKFDLQLNRNAKSLGVRSTYLYRGSSIDIQVFAKHVNGFLHCYKITPRRNVVRTTDQEKQLPFAMPCFVNMGMGGDDVLDHSSQFFSIKKEWTRYYNTIGGAGSNRLLQTNNLSYKRMWCPGRKLITGADVNGINLVRDQDISTRQQTWLFFTFTSSDLPTQDEHMRILLKRTVHFSDSEGSK